MNTKTFSKFVEQYFSYLLTEFEFEMVSEEANSKLDYGIIKFISLQTIILIEADRDELAVKLKPANYPTGIYVNLNWIIEFLTKDTTYLPKLSFPITEETLDYALQANSKLLKLYCKDLLNGDFSWWKNLISHIIEKMKINYQASTGMDLPFEAYQRLQHYLD